MSKALDEWWAISQSRELALGQFREVLSQHVGSSDTPDQLVLIVDELDRCRPDFAVRLLEIIKHVFNVPNVHFVLGTNLDQLRHSVRVVYGEGFDAEKYLQRFVPIVMELGGEYDGLGSPEAAAYYLGDCTVGRDLEYVVALVKKIAPSERVTFRDMERLFTLCRVTRTPGHEDELYLFAAFAILKICRPIWYEDPYTHKAEIIRFLSLKKMLDSPNSGRIDRFFIMSAYLMCYFDEMNDLEQIETLPQITKENAERHVALARERLSSFRV